MTPRTVSGLTGVYHAEGSLTGEVRYAVGKLLGRSHCALCDITHGAVREKPAWREACRTVPVPFETVHLDERSEQVRSSTDGRTPAVVAQTTEGIEVLLGPAELDACGGDPEALVVAVLRAMDDRDLVFAP